MPTLPPPSKSYPIKADDLDHSDYSNSSDNIPGFNSTSELVGQRTSSYDESSADDDDDDEEDDDGESVEDLPCSTTPQSQQSSSCSSRQGGKKKKKKKGKKKGKKKNKRKNNKPNQQQQQEQSAAPKAAAAAAAAVDTPSKNMKKQQVQFGTVTIHEFARCLGTSVVPGDGGWPLGLEMMSPLAQEETCKDNKDNNKKNECSSLPSSSSVNDYEAKKLARLQERWKQIAVNNNSADEQRNNHQKQQQQQQQELLLLPTDLETRQWDYKKGKVKNPLFGILTEKERMRILLVDSGTTVTASLAPAPSSSSSSYTSNSTTSSLGGGGSSSSSSDKRLNVQHPKRSRSGSFGSSSSNSNTNKSSNASGGGATRTVTRSRSGGSVGNSSSSANSGSTTVSSSGGGEQYNDTYTEFQVHHVRNELEQLRVERSKIAGCACRKLSVYIPPPGSVVGKKAQHRRMNLPRVKEELKKRRYVLPANNTKQQSREELELLLYNLVQQEPCCGNDCFCVRNGIDCQADACSCWYTSHQQKTGSKTMTSSSSNSSSSSSNNDSKEQQQEMNEPLSVAAIQERCGNKYGMYAVDLDAINDFRKNYYGAPVDSTSSASSDGMENNTSNSTGSASFFLCLPAQQE